MSREELARLQLKYAAPWRKRLRQIRKKVRRSLMSKRQRQIEDKIIEVMKNLLIAEYGYVPSEEEMISALFALRQDAGAQHG